MADSVGREEPPRPEVIPKDFEPLHEITKQPSWETKQVCTCGERCSNWMEFYRHRGDAYLAALIAALGEFSPQPKDEQ